MVVAPQQLTGLGVHADDTAFDELDVYNFDGTNALKLSSNSSEGNGPERVQLSADGSKLLYGTSSLLYNTDGAVQDFIDGTVER